MAQVTRTERGWGGHFIASPQCLFRRNTLLQSSTGHSIVVSTVGAMRSPTTHEFDTVGLDRYYETMAFYTHRVGAYEDADVSRQVAFGSQWSLDHVSDFSDNEANSMHEEVVKEITAKLINEESITTYGD